MNIRKKSINEIIQDKGLAALGDTYVNFVYSLVKSKVIGKPQGERVRGKVLAEALKNSGLRSYLPNRLSSHELSDAVEALLVYSWLNKLVSLDEVVSILSSQIKAENFSTKEQEWKEAVKAFTFLLIKTKGKLKS